MPEPEVMFEEDLRQALKHIYEPALLRKSPLIKLFGLEGRPNATAVLRDLLQAEIEALKPPPDAPPDAASRRHYEVLFYRYIQQFPQRVVACQLALSVRQLRREQEEAIQALAEHLRARFALPSAIVEPQTPPATQPQATRQNRLEQEMTWLGASLAGEWVEVRPAIEDAIVIARTLAASYNVRLTLAIPDLPAVAVAPTVFEQIVLNLLTAAIQAVPNGEIHIAASLEKEKVCIAIQANSGSETGQALAWNKENVRMARRLAQVFGGSITAKGAISGLTAAIMLPCKKASTLLVVEDNTDTLQLWRRYVQATRYQLISLADPRQLVEAASQLQPAGIIMDVIMPGLDGWRLLQQLRENPATCQIPVIVCTVLPQAELALSLGASGFIRKPATRQEFLSALERCIAHKREV
jgi:CheY-like chemotaxis protein